MSRIDVVQHQIPTGDAAPKDREKIPFTTPLSLYESERMPFGLCNVPATFQCLMQCCLGGQVSETLLIYLDDVIVYSPDFSSHLEHLDSVFEKLSHYGLKLQPDKYHFFKPEVSNLGHVVNKSGIAPNPEKTAIVRDWPCPHTVTRERSFLGFVGYYRRFVLRFAAIAGPLHV